MGRGFSPLCCAKTKKSSSFRLSKVHFVAGLFRTAIVIAAGDSSEAGCGVLLIELFATLSACSVFAYCAILEGSCDDLSAGLRFIVIGRFHGCISIGVIG